MKEVGSIFFPWSLRPVSNHLTLYSMGYFQIMTSFSISRQHPKKFKKKLSKVLNTFENIMENGAFALLEQMLPFP